MTGTPSQPIDAADQLRKLGELRDAGLLTPEEFEAKKAQVLARDWSVPLPEGHADAPPEAEGAIPGVDVLPAPAAKSGSARPYAILGGVIFVAIVAALGVFAVVQSGALSPHHTVNGTFVIVGETCGSTGYSDIKSGTPVTLRDGDNKILGSTSLPSGAFDATAGGCAFKFAIDGVPEVPFYSIEVGRRGQVTNSLEEMKNAGWTFGLSLGG